MVKATPSVPVTNISQSSVTTYASKPVTISWSSSNATTCTISKTKPNGFVVSNWASGTSGSKTATPYLIGTHTWTETCTGEGGTRAKTISHRVIAPPSVPLVSSTTSSGRGPVCGNNLLETGEQCDDGNTVNGDSCDDSCQIEKKVKAACGDGVCESAQGENFLSCPADCTIKFIEF